LHHLPAWDTCGIPTCLPPAPALAPPDRARAPARRAPPFSPGFSRSARRRAFSRRSRLNVAAMGHCDMGHTPSAILGAPGIYLHSRHIYLPFYHMGCHYSLCCASPAIWVLFTGGTWEVTSCVSGIHHQVQGYRCHPCILWYLLYFCFLILTLARRVEPAAPPRCRAEDRRSVSAFWVLKQDHMVHHGCLWDASFACRVRLCVRLTP